MSLIASWSNWHRDADRTGNPSGWRRWRTAWANLRQRWQVSSWQRRVEQEEAYLARAVDPYDLDRRLRALDREERPTRFIGYF